MPIPSCLDMQTVGEGSIGCDVCKDVLGKLYSIGCGKVSAVACRGLAWRGVRCVTYPPPFAVQAAGWISKLCLEWAVCVQMCARMSLCALLWLAHVASCAPVSTSPPSLCVMRVHAPCPLCPGGMPGGAERRVRRLQLALRHQQRDPGRVH
jgi:hypothetical protein